MKTYIHPSKHPSNVDPEKLQELVVEMSRTLNLLNSSEPVITGDLSNDPAELRKKIFSMVMPIIYHTEDSYLKGVVGSVFDRYSAEDAIDELRDINEGLVAGAG